MRFLGYEYFFHRAPLKLYSLKFDCYNLFWNFHLVENDSMLKKWLLLDIDESLRWFFSLFCSRRKALDESIGSNWLDSLMEKLRRIQNIFLGSTLTMRRSETKRAWRICKCAIYICFDFFLRHKWWQKRFPFKNIALANYAHRYYLLTLYRYLMELWKRSCFS